VPAFAHIHEQQHPGGPGIRFAGSLPFLLEIGQNLLIYGTPQTVKGILAFGGLDDSGPSPNALIIGHGIHHRSAGSFNFYLFHGTPPLIKMKSFLLFLKIFYSALTILIAFFGPSLGRGLG
jgi:hypothetical protein